MKRDLAAREARVDAGGGLARQARQARLGRWTARQRIDALLDAGSFFELGRYVKHRHADADPTLAAHQHPGDGLVCGFGRVDGRPVAVYAHDPTVLRGALGLAASGKLCRLMDRAAERRTPLVALVDCDGVRVPEGADAILAYGHVIDRTIRYQGIIPQLTLVSGLCVGAAAYNATLTDAVGMVAGQSFMFITGPKVTEAVTGEAVAIEALGGPDLHARQTGACHRVLPDEAAGVAWLQALLHYLQRPQVPSEDPVDRPTPRLAQRIPEAQRRAYDMRKVLELIFDADSLLELRPDFGGSLLTVLARLGGRAVAVVASQPMALAGCLDINASRKGADFVTFASQRGLPVLTLVDVPGYLPGAAQEAGGIIPHGATLLTAYARCTTPRVCLVVRKSYGGANVLSFAADVRLALPTAQIAPMGVEAAVRVALGPPREDDPEDAERRAAFRAEWTAAHGDVWSAAEQGYLDRIVAPDQVRSALAAALSHLEAR